MSETRLFFNLYFLLLSVTPAEFSVVVGQDVQAAAGEDIVLPCHLEPPFDVRYLTVHWTRDDRTVHVYRHRKDDHNLQDKQFRDRTSLFPEEMSRGNISLKLTNVKKEDSGLYSCYLPRLDSQVNEGMVLLTVNPRDQDGGREGTGGNNETEDDQEESKVNWTGVIAGSVGAVLVLLVFAVIAACCCKCAECWRTQRKKHRNHQRREGPNTAEKIHLEPVP